MKITKEQLKQIIKEELGAVLLEKNFDTKTGKPITKKGEELCLRNAACMANHSKDFKWIPSSSVERHKLKTGDKQAILRQKAREAHASGDKVAFEKATDELHAFWDEARPQKGAASKETSAASGAELRPLDKAARARMRSKIAPLANLDKNLDNMSDEEALAALKAIKQYKQQ